MRRSRLQVCCGLAAALLAAACTSRIEGDEQQWSVSAAPLELEEQDWNAGHAELGHVAALTEDGDDVIVFGDQGASVIAGGAVNANDPSVTEWRAAANIPGADGNADWPIGIDKQGQLYRLRAGTTLENVSDRYGLAKDQVWSAVSLGPPYVAFALGHKLAVANGADVIRYDMPAAQSLSTDTRPGGSREVAAVAADGSVRALDVTKHEVSTLSIPHAIAATFVDGELLVQTPEAVHVERDGAIDALYRAKGSLHGLVSSAGRIWLAEGKKLCALDKSELACSSGSPIAANSSLIGSSSGDVWVLTDGTLSRYGVRASGDEASWRAGAFSVYARVCSACHAPGGTAGVDLSTYAAWTEKRAKIYQQVIVARAMPPDRVLADADRDTIGAWTMPK